MVEPLFWNPLPSAAEWLAQRTGRPMDARTLVDTVAKIAESETGRLGGPSKTVIQMVLPKNTKCASLSLFGEPALLPEGIHTRDRLAKAWGPLPHGFTFLNYASPVRDTLCANQLLELLMYGEVTVSLLLNEHYPDGGQVWLMPFGTSHTATLETCGINRADLMALGDLLAPTEAVDTAPATDTANPAPDRTLLATREQLIDAFGAFTGMNSSWFESIKDKPALQAARKVTGQGGRHSTEPLFCPFEVLQWLIDPTRRTGRKLGQDKGWGLFECHFSRAYAAFSVGDPRTD